MRQIKYSKSILVLLILMILLFTGCNFLKAVLPDTNEGTATANTESTTGSNGEVATSANSGDNSNTEVSVPPDLGGITEFVEQEVLVKIKPGADVEKIMSEVGGTIIETLPQISVIRILLEPQVSVAEAIQILGELEEVEYAEPNGICYMDVIPDDTDYTDRQWAPQLTGAESAWDVTTGDAGVTIAITDTGVDGTHPDFGGKVIAGYDTFNNVAISAGDDSAVYWHGTHCAGIAAAIGNNATGIAGVTWGSEIMPIKMCNDEDYSASYSDMAEAFMWAVDNGADIISCSFGGKYYSQTMKDAIDYAVDQGCTMFASMGNSYIDEVRYPAGYQSVIAVGATDAHNEIASFSTTGDHMSVCAPGVEIYSTMPGGGYDYAGGTSMACPFAAGAAALVLSVYPGMSPEEVKSQLEETAYDLGISGFDSTFGYGRVDLEAAVGAQESNKYGVVDVLVNDSLGNPVSGASVIIWQGEAAISTTNSNEDGHAKFEYIQAGEYGISASFPGLDSCLAADNPVTVIAGGTVSKTIAFATAVVYDVSACAITLPAGTFSTSIGMDEFQDKIAQLQEKGLLRPSYMFDNGSKRSIQKSTTPAYTIDVGWHSYYDATGYRVYKSVNGAGYVSVLDWESPPISEWYGLYDEDVVPGNVYSYYVTAYGSGWETDLSEIVTIDTFLPPCSLISPLDSTTITVSNPVFEWSPVGISSFPYGSIDYGYSDLWVYDDTVEDTAWSRWFYDMTTSTVTYDDDGYAAPLVSGHEYIWESWGYGYDVNGNLIVESWSEGWDFAIDTSIVPPVARRALLVGVGDYQDGDDNDLPAPPFDVDKMNDTLSHSGDGFALINELKDLNATKSAILNGIASTFSQADADDVSYFYFSGHGGTLDNISYLIPTDTNGYTNTCISVSELESALSAIPGIKVVFLDSCHSGGFIGKEINQGDIGGYSKNFNDDVINIFMTRDLANSQYQVLTACLSSQTAIELIPSEGDPWGLFSDVLCEGCGYNYYTHPYLADANANGEITLNEAYDYTDEQVNIIIDILNAPPYEWGVDQDTQVYPENSDFVIIEE